MCMLLCRALLCVCFCFGAGWILGDCMWAPYNVFVVKFKLKTVEYLGENLHTDNAFSIWLFLLVVMTLALCAKVLNMLPWPIWNDYCPSEGID